MKMQAIRLAASLSPRWEHHRKNRIRLLIHGLKICGFFHQ
jgi:hypothetical protein